jgi:hypothetical protein
MAMWSSIRAHPVITLVMVACTVGGTALAVFLGPAEWGLSRSLLAGAVGGSGVGFIIVVSRMLGAFGEDG